MKEWGRYDKNPLDGETLETEDESQTWGDPSYETAYENADILGELFSDS